MTLAPISSSPARFPRPAPVEYSFPARDGVELFYRHWPAARDSGKAMLLFHRGHEHSGRYAEFVEMLDLPDVHVFAWDARGHGRSPGERGYAESFAAVVADVDSFARHILMKFGIPMREMVVLGHSVGAVAVAAWVHDYAPPIRAMVLVTPALRVKLYVPLAVPALRLRNAVSKSFVTSYVKAKMLTHDPHQAELYNRDELISRNIATNILLDLYDTSTRLLADAQAIRAPALVLSAGNDWVVKNSAQQIFFERLGSPVKRMETFKGFFHAILHEKERQCPIAAIRAFVLEAFEKPFQSDDYRDADSAGYTKDQFDALSKPLPAFSPKSLNFAMQRLSMKTICKLSRGVRLGWKAGFDSGETLDYVYRNDASGIALLGKWIDWFYLNAIGWRGIRARKTHLQEMLRKAMETVRAGGHSPETPGAISSPARSGGKPIRILDIACGGGRYTLEILREFQSGGAEIFALLRDRSRGALEVCGQTAREMGLKNITCAEGDAFDADSLAAVDPRPNIAIVSGLYELFGENAPIRNSLSGLARAVESGGYLIYTNQPWHPQIEMIARVLVNREHKPWIMRRRTQAEMDALVREAGFEKQDMLIDKHGIFTVSVARR